MYSNNVSMAVSQFDVQILFNLTEQDGKVSDACHIFLSPQHAKAVRDALNQTVGTYEEIFGEIVQAPAVEKLQELVEKGIMIQPEVK